jgi:hypothetical protein
MPQPIYDPSSKWLLEHHGRTVALLGGCRDVISCKSVQSEVVQPRKLPDGLLEVRVRGRSGTSLMLVEIATYPEKRVVNQMMDGLRLVRQARGIWPDGLVIVLRSKGQYRIPEEGTGQSALGWSKETLTWKRVEVWTLSAEETLASPDVGGVPLVPLMQFEGPPEPLLRRCRERIDREGGAQRNNLLAVTQNLVRLRFGVHKVLELFGGGRAMIESPLFKGMVEEAEQKTWRKAIERQIRRRFGALPDSARASLEGLKDESKLMALLDFAIICPSLDVFLESLAKETTPPPAPVSSRRRRKS